jgi:hypothetical protein
MQTWSKAHGKLPVAQLDVAGGVRDEPTAECPDQAH